jgi:hypothetical protein
MASKSGDKDTTTEPRIVTGSSFRQLQQHYERSQLVIYVGAGISRHERDLGIGDWDGFLRGVMERHLLEGASQSASWDPWHRADWLEERIGRTALREEIYRKVREDGVFQRVYTGLLDRDFARGAATLGAVASMCVVMTGFSSGTRGGRTLHYPRVTSNPRIPAVLSTNYDPYLEAAASSMFRTLIGTHPLKPVGAVGSTAGVLGQTPVFHVHGYVPPKADDVHRPIVNPVLTSRDYSEAWANRADSYTIGPQIHLLRHYSALFIGFSFRDEWVNGLLRQIRVEREAAAVARAPHFAFVSDVELAERGPDFFAELGVIAIPWQSPGDIRAALAHLYRAGVAVDLAGNGPLILAEFEPRRRSPIPTGRAVVADSVGVPGYLWTNLSASWHSPVDTLPGSLIHLTQTGGGGDRLAE